MPRCTFLLACLILTRTSLAATPVLDGLFSDWTEYPVTITDPADDAKAAFDLTQVTAVAHGTTLYVHFKLTKELPIQSGPNTDGTLQLKVGLPDETTLIVDFRGRKAVLSSKPAERILWKDLNFTCLPTYASDEYELRVDLGDYDVKSGDEITVDFAGSDLLEKPQVVKLPLPPRSNNRLRFPSPATMCSVLPTLTPSVRV